MFFLSHLFLRKLFFLVLTGLSPEYAIIQLTRGLYCKTLFICVRSTTVFLRSQSFADAVGTTSVARRNGVKWAVLGNGYTLDHTCLFSRCHWFYTTEGIPKNLNGTVRRLPTLAERAERAFQVISQPGERGGRPAPSLRGWGGGLGLSLVRGTERRQTRRAPRARAASPSWPLSRLFTASFSPQGQQYLFTGIQGSF